MSTDSVDEQVAEAGWPGTWVLTCGLLTSAATLAFLAWANHRWPEFNIMGFYLNLVIPVGAMLVGLTAGSGYAIASWVSNAKIGGRLLTVVLLLQVCCYVMAQYQEYKSVKDLLQAQAGVEVSFVEYFDWTTRSFAFDDRDGNAGPELGAWGYGIRLLEVLGFCLGSLIVPAVMMAKPYCNACEVYMKNKILGVLPAGIVPVKVNRKDTEGQRRQAEETQATFDEGLALLQQFKEWIEADDTESIVACLQEHRPNVKEIETQTARTNVTLEHCRRCEGGRVVMTMVTGQANQPTELQKVTWPASPTVVRALRELR